MKESLSGIEIRAIVKEMQAIVGARVDKIFQPQNQEFYIRLHKTGLGQKLIRVKLPSLMYLTDSKPPMEAMPKGFCMYLRKHLSSARILSIGQLGVERIAIIAFDTKQGQYDMIIELFSTGNLILCKDGVILSAVFQKKWKDRSILPKKEYVPPPARIDPFSANKEDLLALALGSGEGKLSKFLAVNLGFGGAYAREILDCGAVEDKITEDTISRSYDEIQKLKEKDIESYLVKEGDEVVDVIPYWNDLGNNLFLERCDSFNKGLDLLFHSEKPTPKKNRKLEKIRTMITSQEEQVRKFQDKIDKAQKSAELIYENYSFLSELFSTIREQKSTRTWNEIKSALEKHKNVSSLDIANKKITLEFQ